MPNIVLVGFRSNQTNLLRRKIDRLMRDLEKKETIITCVEAKTKPCDALGEAPYVIVRSTDASEALFIATKVNSLINLDVEFETI